MLETLGHLLPIAVAVAISSVPIMATVLILLSPNRNRSALPFLLGWLAGIAIVITFFAVAAYALPAPTTKKPEYLAGIALIIVGAGLVILGIVNWRRSAGKPIGTGPKWLQAVGRLGPWSSLALALGLNLRPKSILLGAAGGIFLANPSLSRASSVAVLVIYSVVAASTVGAPIIATLIAPNEMEKKLLAVRNWMEKNNKVISLLIAIMIGIFIIGYGMTRL